jgi:hypothetical protein
MIKAMTAALVIGAAALAAAGGASAENWISFFVIPAGTVLLDHDSVSRRLGHVSARLESTFPQPQQIRNHGKIFTYVKAIDSVDVDCSARVYMNITRNLYGGDGLMALSLNEQDNPVMVLPGTAQAALITAFCS